MAQTVKQGNSHQSRHRMALWGILANAVIVTAALAALLAWGGREVSLIGEPPAVDRAAQQAAWVQQSIDEQVTALGCDDVKRLSPKLAVRPAQASAAERASGHWVFDTAVVTKVSFDEGFAQAKAGKVWIVGWCG